MVTNEYLFNLIIYFENKGSISLLCTNQSFNCPNLMMNFECNFSDKLATHY